jgi:cytochrome c-type biogenesis protein CcmH/NrfG
MKTVLISIFVFAVLSIGSESKAQMHEICSNSFGTPSLGDAWGAIPYVFGKVKVTDLDENSKLPKVSIGFTERARTEKRVIVDKTGNYCFRRSSSDMDALLVVYFDGIEVGRREIAGLGPIQQREDFEFKTGQSQRQAAPGTISAKYNYPSNPKTDELYKKSIEAEKLKDHEQLIRYVKEIVAIDPSDFVAWAKLGSIYLEKKSYDDAESAFKKALELRVDFVPAMVSLGRTYLAQVKTEQALAILQKAVATDPKYARAYQFLGTGYLQAKKGSLGVENLEKALQLDPMGCADAHLLLATLYDRAGAKDVAADQYRQFLEKFPNHPDRKKYEQYIKDNAAK